MPYPQGAIVVASDPFGRTPRRPYLIVSNGRPPFSDEESIAVGITTTARRSAIELTPDRFEAGSLPRESYISPWAVLTLKAEMISKQPAQATTETVDRVRHAIERYLET